MHTSQNPERTAARQCGFHLLPSGRGLTPQLVSWLLNFAKARTSRLTSERYHMCVCGVNAQSDSSFQRGFNSLLHYMVHRMPGLCTIFTDPFIAFGMMRTIGRKKEEATLLTSRLLAILLTPFRDRFTRPTWRKVLVCWLLVASVGQNWPVRTPYAVSCSLPIPEKQSTIASIDSLIFTER